MEKKAIRLKKLWVKSLQCEKFWNLNFSPFIISLIGWRFSCLEASFQEKGQEKEEIHNKEAINSPNKYQNETNEKSKNNCCYTQWKNWKAMKSQSTTRRTRTRTRTRKQSVLHKNTRVSSSIIPLMPPHIILQIPPNIPLHLKRQPPSLQLPFNRHKPTCPPWFGYYFQKHNLLVTLFVVGFFSEFSAGSLYKKSNYYMLYQS